MSDRPGICSTLAELEALAVIVVAQANHVVDQPVDPAVIANELILAMVARGDLKRCSKHKERWIQKDWQKHVKAAGERLKDRAVEATPLDDEGVR